MKFFLISDNVDTCVGLRLAGIEGIVVKDQDEFLKVFDSVIKNPDVGVVLITDKLVNSSADIVYDIKLKQTKPLIVEIPDRDATYKISDSITKYVRDAIGIKI